MQTTEALCHLSVTDIKKPFWNVWFFCKNKACANCTDWKATAVIWLVTGGDTNKNLCFMGRKLKIWINSFEKSDKIQALVENIKYPLNCVLEFERGKLLLDHLREHFSQQNVNFWVWRLSGDQNADEFAFNSNIPQFAEPCLMILNVWEFCLLSLKAPN